MTSLSAGEAKDRLIFLPQGMIQFSLPCQPTAQTEWRRRNGKIEYIIRAGSIVDVKTGEVCTLLPSGKIARAILVWCCTQAKLTKSHRVEIKPSMRKFLNDLGIPWSGANAAEVANQLQALLSCTLQIIEHSENGEERKILNRNMLISDSSELWFINGDLSTRNSSYVTLSRTLYMQMVDAVPISESAYRQLQKNTKSPLVLDIYLWLCLRLYRRTQMSRVSWLQLHKQFGTTADQYKFKQTFRKALTKAQEVYPQARIVESEGDGRSNKGFHGFLLYPSEEPRKNFQYQIKAE